MADQVGWPKKKMFNVSKMVAAEIERSAIFQIGQRPKNKEQHFGKKNWNFDGILVPENGWRIKSDGQKKKCSTSQRWSLLRSKGAPFSKSANGQRTKPNPKPKWRRLTCEERGGRGVHGAEQDKQNERDTQYDDQAVRRRHRRRRVVERQQQTAGLFGQHLAVVVVVVFAGVTLATDHAHTHTHTHTHRDPKSVKSEPKHDNTKQTKPKTVERSRASGRRGRSGCRRCCCCCCCRFFFGWGGFFWGVGDGGVVVFDLE